MKFRRNCLKCSHYLQCKEPAKSIVFSCGRFKETRESIKQEAAILEQALELPFSASSAFEPIGGSALAVGDEYDQNFGGFDAFKTIKSLIEDKRIVSPDIKIPEKDFAEAPNFLTWCISDKFLNQKPFIEQAVIGTKLFAEYCPSCSDQDYLHDKHKVNDSLDKFQRKVALLEYGVCPHCKNNRLHFFKKGLLNPYYELALCAGQRSGKSAVTAMLFSYLTHRMLKLERPNEVYGLLNATVLQLTFVALTFAQAKDTLYEPFYGNVLDAPWYKDYHSMLDHVGSRHGDELYKAKDTFLSYKHRRLIAYAAGPDKRVLRGRTRYGACLAGDTLISTDAGLIRMGDKLHGLHTNYGDSRRKIVDHFSTGVKRVFRARLNNGLYIDSTANHEHRVYTPTGLIWKRTDQLTEGDFVVCSLGGEFPNDPQFHFKYERPKTNVEKFIAFAQTKREFYLEEALAHVSCTYDALTCITSRLRKKGLLTKRWVGHNIPYVYRLVGNFEASVLRTGKIVQNRDKLRLPSRMSPDLASLMGYLVADGNYAQNGPEVSFTSTNFAKIEDFARKFKRVFGCSARISTWVTPNGVDAYSVVFAYNTIKAFLAHAGLGRAWSTIKCVPWSVLEGSKETIIAFLSSAISCDGGMSSRLYYSSRSSQLIHEMQLLFWRLGYAAGARFGQRLSTLTLNAFDANDFLDYDYSGLQKRSYKQTFKKHSIRKSTAYECFRIPGSRKVIGNNVFYVHTHSALNDAEVREYEHAYRHVIDKGFVLSAVKSVTFLGRQKVYDLTVDAEDHAFTANAIATHNSVDELGWFPNDAEAAKNVKMNANEVYIALERSLLTVRASARNVIKSGFFNVPFAYFINISSPSSVRDKIMELVRKAQGSKKIFGLAKPTWEMNPHVPKSALAEEFKKDPVAAMRDYGAQPPLTNSPFIGSQETVEQCFSKNPNSLKIIYKTKKSKDGSNTEMYAELDTIRKSGKPSVLALDAGYSNNSFAFAVGYLTASGKPVISNVGEVIPIPGIRINHSLLYKNLLVDLLVEQNIVLAAADRWNSLKILADMEQDYGAQKRQYSLKYADMQMFKSYCEDGLVTLPTPRTSIQEILKYDQSSYPNCFKHKPAEHLILQLLTVQDTGTAVLKGDQLTDDVARAVFLCFRMLIDEEYADLLSQEAKPVEAPARIEEMGVYRNYSGGSSSSGHGGAGGSGSNIGYSRQRMG